MTSASGTFIPIITSSAGATRTYTEQWARWQSWTVGTTQLCHAKGRISWTGSNGSGPIFINQLPYYSCGQNNNWPSGQGHIAPPYPWPAGVSYVESAIPNGSNYLMMLGYGQNTVTTINDNGSGTIDFDITYETA